LSPVPVTIQTTRCCEKSIPCRESLMRPARDAPEAGSPKTPHRAAIAFPAVKISSSVTMSITPPDSSRALTAFCQLAGLPIRIAEAMVSGCSMA
jgi:hypothetical protein